MKQFTLLILTFFHVLIVHGQVDSFKVEGRTFQFETPKDWVLESKADDPQRDGNSNVVFHYGILTKSLYAFFSVRIIDRNATDTVRYVKGKQKEFDTQLDGEYGIPTIKSTFEKPKGYHYNHMKTKEQYLLCCISENLSLVFDFYGKAKQQDIDVLAATFNSFVKDFFRVNNVAIHGYIPFYISSARDSVDSTLVGDRYLKYHYLKSWEKLDEYYSITTSWIYYVPVGDINKAKFPDNSLFAVDYDSISTSNFVNLSILMRDEPFVVNSLSEQNLDKHQYFYGNLSIDLSNNFHYYIRKLPAIGKFEGMSLHYQTEIAYFLDIKINGTYSPTCFSLITATKNGLDFLYYQEFLKTYIADFVRTNALEVK